MLSRAHRSIADKVTVGGLVLLTGSAILSIGACGGGVTESGPRPTPPIDTATPGPPVVQRGKLTVQVSVESDDAALASTIGLNRAGLTVRLRRNVSAETPRSAVTNADGVAQFDSLLEGRYEVAVDRPLSAAEVARLPVVDQDVGIFAGGTTIDFAPPTRQTTISLVASRRGALIISESMNWRGNQTDLAYPYATYDEVYNASDTTIYLDGMLLGRTWGGMHTGRAPNEPCETFNAAARLDSSSIWLNLIWAFPGSGRDYPLRPGEATVIAMDAINHIAASVDLSNASFEQFGSDADTDNPFSANMRRILGGTGAFGRGFPASLGEATVLLMPAAESHLVVDSIRATGGDYRVLRRAPRAYVLDVLATDFPATSYSGSAALPCRPFLASAFDREPTTERELAMPRALSRKSLGRTLSGVEILQRTRNSARDFELARPLRRSLDK